MFLFVLVNIFLIPASCPKPQGDVANFFTSYIPHLDYTDVLRSGLADKSDLKAEDTENVRGGSSYESSGQSNRINFLPKSETNQTLDFSSQVNSKYDKKEDANVSAVLSNSTNDRVSKSQSGVIMNFFSSLIKGSQKNIKTNPVNAPPDPVAPVHTMTSSFSNSYLDNSEKQNLLISPAIIKSSGNFRESLMEQNMEDSRAGKHSTEFGKVNMWPQVGEGQPIPQLKTPFHPEVGKYDFTNASVDDIDEAINAFLDDYGVKQLNWALRRVKPSNIITPDGYIIQPVAYIDKIPKRKNEAVRTESNTATEDGKDLSHTPEKLYIRNLFEECTLTHRIQDYEKAHPELLTGKKENSKPIQNVFQNNSPEMIELHSHNLSIPSSEEMEPHTYIISRN